MATKQDPMKTTKSSVQKECEQQFPSQWEKLKTLFHKPSLFFDKVAGEQGYQRALFFFVAIFAISQIISWVFSIAKAFLPTDGAISQASVILMAILFGFFGAAFSIAIAFVMPFISSGLNHLGILIYGGRKGYFNTFKPTTYAMVIGIIYGAILIIVNFILGLINPINLIPTSEISFMSILSQIPLSYIILNSIVYIISFIHVLYTQATGISKYHEISKTRAVLGILTISIILTLLIAIPLILLIGYLMSVPAGTF